MRFRDFVEFAKANVETRGRTFTSPDDDWPMTIIADHPGEEPHAWDLPGWVSNVAAIRHTYARAMADAARETKPTKIAFISSTWQVEYGPDDVPKVMPAAHPNRFEAVIVVVADAEIQEGHNARIRRRRYGPPLLMPWQEASREVSGAMFDPWREALR